MNFRGIIKQIGLMLIPNPEKECLTQSQQSEQSCTLAQVKLCSLR
jgi:hypothetical protein